MYSDITKYTECPSEAHELDNTFNPSSQGPYGPGYHDCDVCEGEQYITLKEYNLWCQEQLINKINQSKKFIAE